MTTQLSTNAARWRPSGRAPGAGADGDGAGGVIGTPGAAANRAAPGGAARVDGARAETRGFTRAVPLGLALLGLLWHGLWATTVPGPLDWDPAYYRDVAQHILAGEGAVSGAAWQAALTAGPLPVPADLHWMPLPSRVLLPGLALWPARGDQLTTALLAAAWAPLAWALARALGLRPAAAALAGLWAATGLGWVRFLSTPDVFALYGVIGAVGWLAVLRGATGWAAASAVAAALSRGDGFLFGAPPAAPRPPPRASPRRWFCPRTHCGLPRRHPRRWRASLHHPGSGTGFA
jgi:hypothetical protein